MGAKIYNSKLTKELIEGARLQQQQGQIPSEIAEKVVPVMEVNPKLLRITNKVAFNSLSDGTSAVIFTTDPYKETYLTGCILAINKDVNATSSLSRIITTIGATTSAALAVIRYESATAGEFHQVVNFSPPLLLNRNTAVSLTHATATASIDGTATCFYYEIDNITA